jgi:hypothetical protein
VRVRAAPYMIESSFCSVPHIKSATCPPPARAMRAQTLQDAWSNFKIVQENGA